MEDLEQEIDYKAENEKLGNEIKELKEIISKRNSEIADYKKRDREKLSDEEKRNKDFEDLKLNLENTNKELSLYKQKDQLIKDGFSVSEIEELVANNFSSTSYSKIFKIREENIRKSLLAEQIANRGNEKNGLNEQFEESSFSKFQKSKENEIKKGRIEF